MTKTLIQYNGPTKLIKPLAGKKLTGWGKFQKLTLEFKIYKTKL